MRVDRKLEKRVIRHCLQGAPLSELGLPFRTVIEALCLTGLGAIARDGAYALTFSPILCVCYGCKGATEGLRLDPDPNWRDWARAGQPGVPICGGEIGAIWSALERAELDRLRLLEPHGWAD